MIKNVLASNTAGYLFTNGNGYVPFVSPNSNNPLTGVVRINGNNTEVFDGSSWLQFGNNVDIQLSQSAVAALDWCQRKMIEEQKLKELADKSATVADALKKYEEAKEQLNIVIALTDKS